MSGNDGETRMSLVSRRRKEETDGADCTSSGKVFQKIEAATGNERRTVRRDVHCIVPTTISQHTLSLTY